MWAELFRNDNLYQSAEKSENTGNFFEITLIFAIFAIKLTKTMITKQTLQRLKQIGKTNGWDAIFEIGTYNGRPLYQLYNSQIPKNAKTGMPHLYSLTSTGTVFELDSQQTHDAIISYKGFRKRLQ